MRRPIIYLDHNATTPVDPRVREAMGEAAGDLAGNPSSVHASGRRARAVINESRAAIAGSLRVSPSRIVFTASGSEANNLALKGVVFRRGGGSGGSRGPGGSGGIFRLVVSAIEHESVLYTARYLAERFDWVRTIEVAPDAAGVVSAEAVAAACGDGAELVSVMAVNNETGAIQPVGEMAEAAHAAGALMHVDGVQALGRMAVEPEAWGCDLLSVSAHKIYGPRGIGLLYVRDGIALDSLVHGGHQEKGRRAGTENSEAIVGFARAMNLADAERGEREAHAGELERVFLESLRSAGLAFTINGPASGDRRVAGVINLSLEGASSNDLVIGMDLAGYAISAGSACSSGVIEASHVLQAMRLEPWRVGGGIRVSFGKDNTADEAVTAARSLADLYDRIQTERREQSRLTG